MSLIALLGAETQGDALMWGIALLALGALAICLAALKKRCTVLLSAIIGVLACGVGLAGLVLSGLSAEALGGSVWAVVTPLMFFWGAVFGFVYLFTEKLKKANLSKD